MFRITEHVNGESVRLRLDGTVDLVSLTELEAVCSHYRSEGDKVILLDLAGVMFMSDEPARKLAALRNPRFQIINCSPFIETLLNTVAGPNAAAKPRAGAPAAEK